MGLTKDQEDFNREGVCQVPFFLLLFIFYYLFIYLRFWKEDDLHEVHCPGYGQGAQSRQCVQT
jgi:hypothetical protein